MPSITDTINEKYNVKGATIADAYSQIAGYEPGKGLDNIADALAAAKEKMDEIDAENEQQ